VVWWQVRIGEHGILAVRAPVIAYMYLRRYTLPRQCRTCLVLGGDAWSVVDEVPFIRNKFADEEQEIFDGVVTSLLCSMIKALRPFCLKNGLFVDIITDVP